MFVCARRGDGRLATKIGMDGVWKQARNASAPEMRQRASGGQSGFEISDLKFEISAAEAGPEAGAPGVMTRKEDCPTVRLCLTSGAQ
jgi:hypothetical protein